MSAPKKKNITLSANPAVLERARMKALKLNTTLNNVFREWLNHFIQDEDPVRSFDALMESLKVSAPRKFSRDEMHER